MFYEKSANDIKRTSSAKYTQVQATNLSVSNHNPVIIYRWAMSTRATSLILGKGK